MENGLSRNKRRVGGGPPAPKLIIPLVTVPGKIDRLIAETGKVRSAATALPAISPPAALTATAAVPPSKNPLRDIPDMKQPFQWSIADVVLLSLPSRISNPGNDSR
ncbi:hypothetical protein [Mesorhizobium sp. M0578]|uniref:hypothetical protein n=1 Tax=unclassified Mesorhizobium TaxID=325217 RepID=UPI00333872B3